MTLPFARPSLPSPKSGASTAPLRFVTGNPSDALRGSLPGTFTSLMLARKPLLAPVPAAFDATYVAARKFDPNPYVRAEQRRLIEQTDRMIRFRASSVRPPFGSGRTGMDWIREGRLIAPSLPGGRRGLVRPTTNPILRGDSEARASAPAGKVRPQGEEPISSVSLPPRESLALPVPNPEGRGENVNPTLYVFAALAVVGAFVMIARR